MEVEGKKKDLSMQGCTARLISLNPLGSDAIGVTRTPAIIA